MNGLLGETFSSHPIITGIFIALAATFIGWLSKLLIDFLFKKHLLAQPSSQNQHNNQNVVIHNNFSSPSSTNSPSNNLANQTSTVNVLFIDDETRFKIVNILKKNSWINCQIIKDLDDFNSPVLLNANIIFVDIEGVGRMLTPQEQGLGIVKEIKTRYPNKRVVIYSSKPERDMTHPAFQMVEGILRKDAQPSEFLKYIEDARN
jgi:hypothetical protein